MGFAAYRAVLRIRDVRRVLLLSLVVRIPLWAGNIVLTLHVITHLHRSYSQAGFLTGVVVIALAVSAPWRGRRLDRVGLRAAVAPSLVVMAACWSVAPFVGYWLLLVLASAANLFNIPSFTIVRQALMFAVDDSRRRTVLAIDSVMVEITFMVGPAAGVVLATYAPTQWALFGCEFASIAGGIVFWFVNPPLRAPGDGTPSAAGHRVREWLTPGVVAILAISAAATVVLSGTDVSVVAALRHMHHQPWIGWELTIWGLGSAVGGAVYGALHRRVPLALLLALLAGLTLPAIAAPEPFSLAVLLFIAGVPCAPTITAAVEALSRLVPEAVRGEALGWHGSAMTTGSALGAPLAGIAIDRMGWQGGFLLPSLVGLGVAALGLVALRRAPAGESPVDGSAAEQLAPPDDVPEPVPVAPAVVNP
jgi:MFS family permease